MEKIDTMKPYDIIYDALLFDNELYNYHTTHNIRELMDGDDGYTSFLVDKLNEFEKRCDEYYSENFSNNEAIADFIEKNIEKWERELNGVKRCKVKVVLEVELDAATGCNMPMVEELVKSNLIYDIDQALEYENASVKILNVVGKEVDE